MSGRTLRPVRYPHVVGVRVDDETLAALERVADRLGVSVAAAARDALGRGLPLAAKASGGRKSRPS